MIPPISILKVFPLQNVFEIKKCSSTKCFRTLRRERFDGKSLEAPAIFSAQTVFDTKNLVKHRRFPLQKSFVTMRHNNSEVLLHSRPLSYPKNVSILERLWNTEGYSTKSFATVRQKNRRHIKILTSPYIHKKFANQIVSEPQKRSSTKNFGTVWQNNFDVQFTPFRP